MPRTLIINGSKNKIDNEIADIDGTKLSRSAINENSVIENFTLTQSVTVSNTRGPGSRQEIKDVNENDIVEIKFEDSSTWIGNATEFQEIFNLAGKRGMEEDGFEVPTSLQGVSDRNIVTDLAINVFNFFKKKESIMVGNAVHGLAQKVEDKVQPQPGLFLLDNAMRKKIAGTINEVSKPFLLFIHGTNSNTEGAFGALLDNKQFGL